MAFSDLIAAIAIILSIISLYLQLRDKRPRLDVRPRIQVREFPSSHSVNKSAPALAVYLSNPSEKPIHIKNIWLIPRTGQKIQIFEFHTIYPKFSRPFTIDPLRGRDFLVLGQEIADDLTQLGYKEKVQATIVVHDETNRQYKSKRIRFSIAQLIQPETSPETQPQ